MFRDGSRKEGKGKTQRAKAMFCVRERKGLMQKLSFVAA